MLINDPVGDLLARIRNALGVRHQKVMIPNSRLRRGVLDVLKREGYILGYEVKELRQGISQLVVDLKYYEGLPAIYSLERVSKPGRRFYEKSGKLPKFFNGLGTLILSTSKGVLSESEARQLNVGGEILCRIF